MYVSNGFELSRFDFFIANDSEFGDIAYIDRPKSVSEEDWVDDRIAKRFKVSAEIQYFQQAFGEKSYLSETMIYMYVCFWTKISKKCRNPCRIRIRRRNVRSHG